MNAVSPDAIRAETITITGHRGDEIEAYRAMPLAEGSRGGIVWIHHMPGYDRETKEFVRRLAVNGYHTVAPNLYSREAPGAEPDDAAAAARAAGGVPDERLVGDVAGAVEHLRSLPGANARFGVIGHCSGGRHAYLAACSLPFDAAVDCYGAFIVEDPPEGMPKTMNPILSLAANLSCPLLGLFGVEDRFPAPAGVAALDAELTGLGKPHWFTSYEGAGHAFFSVDRPAYRAEAALDGWRRIDEFFAAHRSSGPCPLRPHGEHRCDQPGARPVRSGRARTHRGKRAGVGRRNPQSDRPRAGRPGIQEPVGDS